MKMRALDNAGAYAGRAPFQLGKPIGAIVGPYKIESVQYRAQSVTTNKAVQEAVRGFGQAPTNYAIETAIDKVAAALGLDRIEVRRRNFIRKERVSLSHPERHAATTAATITPWSPRCSIMPISPRCKRERDRLRASGHAGRHRHRRLPGAERRQFIVRAAAQSRRTPPRTWMDSCRIHVDGLGFVTVTDPHHLVRPGPRDAGRDRGRRSAARSIPI